MPRRPNTSILVPDQAAQAVSILIHEGKLKLRDLTRALQRREEMISELRARLTSLVEGTPGKIRRRSRGQKKAERTKPRKTATRISKRQRAAQQAQGRYLGAISRLPAETRAKVKAIREKSGVRAAVAAAKKMARS